MSTIKLQAAREFILDEQYDTARTILMSLPSSPTAKKWLAKLNEIAPSQEAEVMKLGGWEYLEVYVKASERVPTVDWSSVLDDQELTTLNHFYTRMLNDYGAQGWELVSETEQGGDVIRLLFKRAKTES